MVCVSVELREGIVHKGEEIPPHLLRRCPSSPSVLYLVLEGVEVPPCLQCLVRAEVHNFLAF